MRFGHAEPGPNLLIRDVEVEGRRVDVRILGGRIAEIGPRLAGEAHLEGRGGALIPGLIDHHVHLLATAAAWASLRLEDVRGPEELAARLRAAPGTGWLRATGFHEHDAGPLDRHRLDRILPDRPVRVQHQTGAVWFLNSAALARLDLSSAPEGVDVQAGRLARADDWLRTQLGAVAPDLAPVGGTLAAAGVTGVTDASVSNDAHSLARLAEAQASGALPQRVMAMSGGPLAAAGENLFTGPVKILLDEHDLPPLEAMTERIAQARRQGRRVAVHCVAAGELALTLAAFQTAGVWPGDRIEHGGVIPEGLIGPIATLGLTVVTQSVFVFERGDRYLAEVEPYEQPDLYRCASLKRAGVPVGGSSDAPYGGLDPWAAMRAAVARRTAGGAPIGPQEAVAPGEALDLYLGRFARPGGSPRRVEIGQAADLCLLKVPLDAALVELSTELVAATVIGDRVVYAAS